MPTKKDFLLFLKAEIDWYKEHVNDFNKDKIGLGNVDKTYKLGFIKGLEHAYKIIKGLK